MFFSYIIRGTKGCQKKAVINFLPPVANIALLLIFKEHPLMNLGNKTINLLILYFFMPQSLLGTFFMNICQTLIRYYLFLFVIELPEDLLPHTRQEKLQESLRYEIINTFCLFTSLIINSIFFIIFLLSVLSLAQFNFHLWCRFISSELRVWGLIISDFSNLLIMFKWSQIGTAHTSISDLRLWLIWYAPQSEM